MAQKLLLQQLSELGLKLDNPPASKDALMKLLKQGAGYLSELDQSPLKSVLEPMQPFLIAIAKPELLKHQDREVKLFVAVCICEITRITAPDAPYDDDLLKDIFQLIVSTFSGLSDTNGPSFGRRVVILETLARYRSCVVMLDLECDDLVNEMFSTFFTVARDEHPENVLASMQIIMEVLLEESEDVQEDLLLVLLSVLGRNKRDVTLAARRLAMNVIGHCAAKLEPGIKQFLVSSISGDNRSLKCQINYHEVIYDIHRCAPQILLGVIPFLTGELLTDQLDTRLKAVGLVGDLFALPGSVISEAFQPMFLEFLKRVTDRVVEIRMSVLEHVKICLLANPFRAESQQIISALCDRLLDYDENVRKQVVSVVCDVACHSLTSIPVVTIKLVAERLRDKSFLVKKYTMDRLADIFRVYCLNRSPVSSDNDEYDWIVGKILRCFYDKDFRSDTIEPILCLSLFPSDYSVKDKVTGWIRVFSGFDKVEVKALEKILEQKQRLQQEMQKYLSFRQLSQEGDATELRKKVLFGFRVMSRCFTDPARAEETFQILDQLKDSNIWKLLASLLDPNNSSLQASSSQSDLLCIVGEKHQLYEFLNALSLKCAYLLFNKEHVKEILLEAGIQKSAGNTQLLLSCMTILVILARFCPSLLGGIEEDLIHLLDDDNEIIREGVMHILAKAGATIREHLGVSSRSLNLILKQICIEGSRRQAKYAVLALASITKDDGLMSLSVLYKRLVNMLEEKSHLPSVLQSLGIIASIAMPVFETKEREVQQFIKKNILECSHMSGYEANGCWDDRSELCSLKIFGLKTLVKSYLPLKDVHLCSGIDDLMEILKNILAFGEISRDIKSSLVDKAHLKLAAAKSVLRLSKHWEHKIPVGIFYLTLRTSEADFPEVKKLLQGKVHQYVKERILDPKYACIFLLDIGSQHLDFEENKHNMKDIIRVCQQGRARQVSTQRDANSPPLYPEYLLIYVVHALAHHSACPNVDECKDIREYEAIYRQLYLFLSMLLHGGEDSKSDVSIDRDRESISLMKSIFLQIKRLEDAFDATKSKNSYALCDLGLSIIKRLAPKQDDLQDLNAPVNLPPVLYKPLEKRKGNKPEDEGHTWLADDSILVHFESVKLEAIGTVSEVVDDGSMDSETEGNEMPLSKMMKRLKAKGAKARKEAKNESASAGVKNENDVDILNMVKEISSDSLGITRKFESNSGHDYVNKKYKSDIKPQKRKKVCSESTDVPLPKRRSSSGQTQMFSALKVTSKSNTMPVDDEIQEALTVDFTEMNDEFQIGSEDEFIQENITEPAESDLLVSCVRKKSGTTKQKRKRSNSDNGEAHDHSNHDVKKKKVMKTDGKFSISNPKLGSTKKRKQENVAEFAKSTLKDNRRSLADLIGCMIKVWWPSDKKFYEGVVKSFDSQKKKHVILYDDGDVEVLRLDKERWELVDNGQKAVKRSNTLKGSRPEGVSSGIKRKSIGRSREDKKMSTIFPPSQARRKRSTREKVERVRKGVLKSKSSAKRGGSRPIITQPESSTKSSLDDVESEEPNEIFEKSSADEEQSDKDDGSVSEEKQMEDAEDVSSNAAQSKEEEIVETDSQGSQFDDMNSHPHLSNKPGKGTPPSDFLLADFSDDEPLSTWKHRVGK
ncbi:sister chromatid cohesion PDS5 homolog A isoform X1 [Olea europaea subsp. europaea]|uniref:Sister chromatid cohesion PDS5 homolog A isoform X1 n=1 Tax=Olea europaea subsp. europaea TaxID=158383 RepID=A0A8S0S839_OLEEU|nr:sister chromatid cohesion PDS5 homolog A isoform X1 [Olea europaea subsp. europaea]